MSREDAAQPLLPTSPSHPLAETATTTLTLAHEHSFSTYYLDITQTQNPRSRANITNLPSDVLAEIFVQCPPFPPSLAPHATPRVLTGVCRRWRRVALERTSLWSTIRLPGPSEVTSARLGSDLSSESESGSDADASSSTDPKSSADNISDLCHEHLLSAVSLFLTRSRNSPLHVDLGLVSGTTPWRPSGRYFRTLEAVIALLARPENKSRIRALENVPPTLFGRYFISSSLRNAKEALREMKMLKVLTFADREDLLNHHKMSSCASGKNLEWALPPSLKTLRIRHASLDLAGVTLPETLTELVLQEPVGSARLSVALCLRVLMALPSLRVCHLDVTRPTRVNRFLRSNSNSSVDSVVSAFVPEDEPLCIRMSELEEFSLTWRGAGVDVSPIFNSILFPTLKTLILRSVGTAIIPWRELALSVERSEPPLQNLSVISGNDEFAPAEALTETLRVWRGLKCLTLAGLGLSSEFLRSLVYDTASQPWSSRSWNLLPGLRCLNFHWCKIEDFSALLEVLRSRGSRLLPPKDKLDCFALSTRNLSSDEMDELCRCGVLNINVRTLKLISHVQ